MNQPMSDYECRERDPKDGSQFCNVTINCTTHNRPIGVCSEVDTVRQCDVTPHEHIYNGIDWAKKYVGLEDLCEDAWGLISNAGGGNWKKETSEWQGAAAKWREAWHATFNVRKTK